MEKILAIYDSDLIYTIRFLEYFKNKKDFNFEISAFTRKESLEEFLQLHQIEILLLGGQALQEELPLEKIKFIYRFTDDPREEKDAENPVIFKYQSAQRIMTEVINDYNKKENENQVKSNSKRTKIISVYAPITGVEKLAFAWSVSALLSEQKKVLFVPLELLPTQLLSFVNDTNEFLSEFIYYLKENPNTIMRLKTLLGYSGNLSYLTGLAHGFDVLALSKEDIRKWGEETKLYTDYQTIVFYLGYYAEATIELINISDSVLIPTLETPYETATLQEWERQTERIGISINHDKFIKIRLQEEEALGKEAITLQELAKSRTFSIAQNYVNS